MTQVTTLLVALIAVIVTTATVAMKVQSAYASASQFAPDQEVKSGEASTAESVAPGQQAAALGGNGATYAPGQEEKKPISASVITNQC